MSFKNFAGSGLFTIAVVLAVLPGGRAAADQKPKTVTVGLRTQLFVDDHVVASAEAVTRKLGRVTKANGGKPIFTEGWFYGTVLFDDGRFKMWWRKPGKAGFGLAESNDGIHFTKKSDLEGINFAGDYTLSVMIDPNASGPAHRYKAAYDAPGMAAGLAHSPDGIHWTPYNNGRPVTHRAADTYNQIVWDADAKLYRLFTRTDFGTAGGTAEFRGTRSMTNPDVHRDPAKWKPVRNWVFDRHGKAEASRRQIYSLTDWIRHGVHFGLMSVYEWPGDASEGGQDKRKRHERDVMNFYVGTSRDADSWDLSWVYSGQPMIPRGPDGSFDKDLLFPASTIVTHAGKHWLYYAGANERHGGPRARFQRDHAIGLATLPEDRFVGLEASGRLGIVTTRPFQLDGSMLSVNVDGGKAGRVRVAVLDAGGKPIEGLTTRQSRPVTGDHLHAPVTWAARASLKPLVGKTIRLRFHLRDASLYAFRISR